MSHPIVQFGTSRFLQAHVDLFVSQALERGQALGRITVVQTSGNPVSRARVAALASGAPYPVRIRGLHDGAIVDTTLHSTSIAEARDASLDWPLLRARFEHDVRVVVSNTGDSGYAGFDTDTAASLEAGAAAPRGFAAKLAVLLHGRFLAGAAPITLLPCELVSANGDTLGELVIGIARAWQCDAALIDYLRDGCIWVNSLVDRIVSEPIEPAGAVAEPYALWAIERRAGMVLPCEHASIVLTDDLAHVERLKLWLLNLGHTVLAAQWLNAGRPQGLSVAEAMNDEAWRAPLEALWRDDVLPVFDALGEAHGTAARAYLVTVRERFANPFLRHRIADIAQHHASKLERRLRPVRDEARRLGLGLAHTRLDAVLAGGGPGVAAAQVA
ncbi:MAG: Altronate oxidoreductase [Burkholderia plantarii]|nr:MAG: Altronate oxidoreductase [Burkholderia plantarii]